MAVRNVIIYGVGDTPNWGGAPQAPTAVTSITADASATISFRAPSDVGSGAVTHWVVTPYIGATAQATTTTAVASAGSITGSDGNTYVQVPATGLTNGSAHTFTVKARNAYGDSAESTASGANTPLSGLVFGDDFNGPAGGPIDPEWWVYNNRCGYLNQNEVQGYAADHCVLDGSGKLKLTAEHVSISCPRYPSDPSYPGTIIQPWTSGACQSNTKVWTPTAGNTMTFEVSQQVNADAGSGYWPGLFWLAGQAYLTAWKTDPQQLSTDTTTHAEIDVAEWFGTGSPDSYGNVSWAGTNEQHSVTGTGLSTAQHVYKVAWKPGISVVFSRDGSQTYSATSQKPASGASFMLLLYLQMLAGGPTTTESCLIDYVRVYDQNLG
jgi:hypothetical protein